MGIRQQPIKTTATTESKAIKAFQVLHTLPRVSVPDTMQGVTKVWMDGEAAKIDREIESLRKTLPDNSFEYTSRKLLAKKEALLYNARRVFALKRKWRREEEEKKKQLQQQIQSQKLSEIEQQIKNMEDYDAMVDRLLKEHERRINSY